MKDERSAAGDPGRVGGEQRGADARGAPGFFGVGRLTRGLDGLLPWLLPGLLIVMGAIVFCTGITWGLPSRRVDKFLFGERPVWSGEQIQQLAGGWTDDPRRGADVDVDPLAKGSEPILLNQTDAQRAEIVRRYRLYTYQPDEMITMRALAGMRPGEGRLDPRLYQYGGLWIYPVGAMLKLGSVAKLVTLKPDVAWYLDHPEEFGRLYVVARLYTVMWGLVGIGAVFWITRRLTGGRLLPAAFAALCFIWMPVVINMAHEAKPHLPGAVLQLLAVAAAIRYAETGRSKWWLATGILCGAAFGMVLSAWPVFVVLPLMTVLRRGAWLYRAVLALGGVLVGVAVYLLTNPYIVINLFVNRDVLRSNFGNSLAMYEIGRWPEGVLNAARLVAEGASVAVASVGFLAAISVAVSHASNKWRARKDVAEPSARRSLSPTGKAGLLVAAPALLILLQFVALAAGKPGEYGRFAVFPDVALGIAAVVAISRLLEPRALQVGALVILLLLTAIPGHYYLAGFRADSGPDSSRVRWARYLENLSRAGMESLAMYAEPAPYSLPPVDLFSWRLLLLPDGYVYEPGNPPADVLVRAIDDPYAKISWANKPFVFWIRRALFPLETRPEAPPIFENPKSPARTGQDTIHHSAKS